MIQQCVSLSEMFLTDLEHCFTVTICDKQSVFVQCFQCMISKPENPLESVLRCPLRQTFNHGEEIE